MSESVQSQLETWKRRYYDSVEQAEARERQWAGMEELLRKTISRLSLAADGLDETLDRQLRELRDAIRDRADDRTLQKRIEAMSATLIKLDTDRGQAPRSPGAVEVLQSLLEQTRFPRGNARRLKGLSRELERTDEAGAERAAGQVAALLSEILAERERQSGDSADSARGLRRWFGGRAAAAPAGGDGAQTALEAQRELLRHCLERLDGADDEAVRALRGELTRAAREQELRRQAEALLELAAQTAGAASPAASAPAPDAGREILLQLLEQLGLPEAFDDRVGALQQRLEEEPDCEPLEVLHRITDLVAEMRMQLQREKQEIEDFLQQLTDRLQDVDSFVKGSEGERRAAYMQGRELGDAVQAEVRGIETDVRDAQDLSLLKQTVQARIDAIVTHVEQHRQAEVARNEAAEARVEALQQRLQEMEQEAGELRERVHQQRSQAVTDALTGIPNRLAWDERLQQEYARWKRFRTPLALLVWDVDNFKPINDEYGHKAGDKVLRVIAGILADNIRETDFIARFGGEEFAMLVSGAGVEDVAMVAEKLRAAIEDCGFHYRGQAVPITISCGIALFDGEDTMEAVFERADQALYRAKAQGRNRCLMAGTDAAD